MPNQQHPSAAGAELRQSNAQHRYEVVMADLPVHCPLPDMSLWDSHPRVYIPLEQPGDKALCPYCGAEFVLTE